MVIKTNRSISVRRDKTEHAQSRVEQRQPRAPPQRPRTAGHRPTRATSPPPSPRYVHGVSAGTQYNAPQWAPRRYGGLGRALGPPPPTHAQRRRPVVWVSPDRASPNGLSEVGTDVIDLGAPRPRAPHAPPATTRPLRAPNPRLYPGPQRAKPKLKPKPKPKRSDNRGAADVQGRRRKRVRRTAATKPNPRLYARAPPRPQYVPPPVTPSAPWTPQTPDVRLETASEVALRVTQQRRPDSPRLVVKLPAPVQHERAPAYRPMSAHFRYRSLDTDSGSSTPVAGRSALRPAVMDAPKVTDNRHSTSPEDYSDPNEPSAPSEYLAEFLSAIMRRQYVEALKYCRLILQYEPHNATARGFFPLLQQKIQIHQRGGGAGEWARGSSSEDASDAPAARRGAPGAVHMEQGGDSDVDSSEEAVSCASQSSLELDSSPSVSLSRRTERTDSPSLGGCDTTGSASRSDTDDNGNAACALQAPAARLHLGDLANDNAPSSTTETLHKSSSSLRRLRAQFTCSIK